MSIQSKMRGFWWFDEGHIAGMGQPGFNRAHWYDFPFEQAAVYSWLGQHLYHQPDLPLASLWTYLSRFGPKAAPFYGLTPEQAKALFVPLHDLEVLKGVLGTINEATHILDPGFVIDPNDPKEGGPVLHCHFHHEQATEELMLLKEHGIDVVISLMEEAPPVGVHELGLDIHHISVPDLTPPTEQQLHTFARLLFGHLAASRGVVVHCFAGVGRTSTMLLAAHLLRGEALVGLRERLALSNPHFLFKGRQWAYVESLAASIEAGEVGLLEL